MSIPRQTHEPVVRSYSVTHPPGTVTLPTGPGWDRIVFSPDGLFTARTARRAWTVPRHRGLCASDGSDVDLRTTRRTAIRCLYVRADIHALARGVWLVDLGPLSRELLARAVANGPMDLDDPVDRALMTLVAHQMAFESDAALHLPMPQSASACSVADRIMAEPDASLERHVGQAHLHRRTVERRFRDETQMSLGQWRRRARILAAVDLLVAGRRVTDVALLVGYSSPSAFVAAFRSELDTSPRRFLAGEQSGWDRSAGDRGVVV